MELLAIIIFLAIIIISQAITIWNILTISDKLTAIANLEPKPIEEAPKVTDPFTKPKPIYSSKSHIIVPKTPTEIRNQNFKRIKEGVEYGDIPK